APGRFFQPVENARSIDLYSSCNLPSVGIRQRAWLPKNVRVLHPADLPSDREKRQKEVPRVHKKRLTAQPRECLPRYPGHSLYGCHGRDRRQAEVTILRKRAQRGW